MAIPLSRSGRERLADSDMERRIEVALQRQHHHRDLRLGIDDHERHEHAVVEAALGILADLQSGGGDEALDLGGDLRRAGRRIPQLIGVGGEAVIVVEHAGRGGGADGRLRLFPVGGGDDEGLRPLGQRLSTRPAR